jgi:hypothetical protein
MTRRRSIHCLLARPALSIRIAAIAVALAAGSARAQDIPRNEVGFTDYVAARLQQEVARGEGDGPTVVVKAPLTLGVGDFEAQLQRLFAFCGANAGGCGFEIERYVKGAARACCSAIPPK